MRKSYRIQIDNPFLGYQAVILEERDDLMMLSKDETIQRILRCLSR